MDDRKVRLASVEGQTDKFALVESISVHDFANKIVNESSKFDRSIEHTNRLCYNPHHAFLTDFCTGSSETCGSTALCRPQNSRQILFCAK